jgi:shikimate kinase
MKSEMMNIYLCGMMGSGKSAVGRLLAEKLMLPFFDLDIMIEDQESATIPEIFSIKGESYFRDVERKLLIEHLRKNHGVTALGGGSLHTVELTKTIKENAVLVFIDVPLSVLSERLESDKTRPMIVAAGNDFQHLHERLMMLIEQREPMYRMAHLHIEAGAKSADEIAAEISLIIRKMNG